MEIMITEEEKEMIERLNKRGITYIPASETILSKEFFTKEEIEIISFLINFYIMNSNYRDIKKEVKALESKVKEIIGEWK